MAWCHGRMLLEFLFRWFGHHLCKGCRVLVTSAVQTPPRHAEDPCYPSAWMGKNGETGVVMLN